MSRRRDERGAVAVFVALIMTLLIGMAALGVDLGMQRVVRRDMQALADVVALDLARELDGRSQTELAAQIDRNDPNSALAKSLARNTSSFGDNLVVVADWGSWNGSTWNTSTEPPTAVRVTASAEVDFAFRPGKGAASRTAYAESSSTACFRLGSFAAAVRLADSTLLANMLPYMNDFLGVSLDVLSYKGLANADISLAQLIANGTVGDETSLLTGSTSFAGLVQAAITVLTNEHDPSNDLAVQALQTVLAVSGSVPAVHLGSMLGISPTDTAALDTQMSVLDLIMGSVLVANGSHAIEIPNLQAGVAGLGNITTATLAVQQGLQEACGAVNSLQAQARASQLTGKITFPYINLSSLNIGLATLQTSPASGELEVSLANSVGRLVAPPPVHCGNGTLADPSTMSVSVTSGLVYVKLSSTLTVTGKVDILGLGQVTLSIKVDLTVQTSSSGQATVVNLSIPPNDTTPVTTGAVVPLDPATIQSAIDKSGSTATVKVLGVGTDVLDNPLLIPTLNAIQTTLISGDNSFAAKTITPLVANINTLVTGPLAKLLGLTMPGADVYGVEAVCNVPALRG